MDINRITGHLILIMGPTGSGKGSIVRYLRSQFPELQYSISCTTRPMRPGEVDGQDYYFISEDTFDQKISNDEFLEWATFSGYRYGTLRSELVDRIEAGAVIITEIELQGVMQLLQIIPTKHRTLVFIEAGDWSTLKARALARAPMSEEHLALREARYKEEVKSKPYADVVVENTEGKLEEANAKMYQIVKRIFNQVKATS